MSKALSPLTSHLSPLLVVAAAVACACAVGPNYKRPAAPVPAAYKEATPPAAGAPAESWKLAEPRDTAARGKWWEIYADPELSALEDQINVSNQNVAQAEAQFRGARAAVRGARADLFPTITTSPSVTRSQGSANRTTVSTGVPPGAVTTYSLPVDLSYEADVFGRIRRNIEANVANAQASAADLETVRLTIQTELAVDYFLIRGLDAQKRLLDADVEAFQKALQLTINRHNQGVVSGVDVAQAETLLHTTRAQSTDLGVARSQLEHAIAILIGKPPAEFTLAPSPITYAPPAVPLVLPSELLERRPEIAASERRVAAANAQIGVAISAYFPRLLLAASGSYTSSTLADWFTLPSRFWSIGGELAATIFDGGRRRAQTEQARAAWEAAVAVYRLEVLTAFQQVEDNLAALRILAEEAVQQADAVEAAERALELAKTRYEGGITSYLEVLVAQSTALTNERTAVDVLTRRMTASVNLIKALGGGWRDSDLPYGRVPPPPQGTATE